jgi:hypothetical protein
MIRKLTRPLLGAAVTIVGLAAAAFTLGASPASASTARADPPVIPAVSNLFASVSLSGTLVAGNDVSGVTRLGTGRYEVTFGRNVASCAYVATTVNAHSQALQVFTAGGHLSADGVYVETKNQGGGLTDGPFNLAVDCGAPGWYYAVAGYAGNLVRATPGTTLVRLGTGRYGVTLPNSVDTCAYLATVGDPGDNLVFSPAGVYTGSGSGSRTVYIETKNPGGGLADGIPFHLAVICPYAARTAIAVVSATGIPSRGSALTSSFSPSTGHYTIVTSRNQSACATIATRGSANTSVPFDPATVEVATGPAANTTGIQVRSLLFFGGSFASESFHAAMIC